MSHFQIRVGMNPTDFTQNSLCFNMSDFVPSGDTMSFPCLNVIRGRYVSIQRYFPYDIHGKGLQICEVQIIPSIPDKSLFNIAPYGTASQSSTLYRGKASHAIDGFEYTDYIAELSCTATDTADANPGWWKLDMKQALTITLVRLTNRNLFPERLSNFEIRVGFDDVDFSKNSLCFYMPGMVTAGATQDFPCLMPTQGRYLTIQRFHPLAYDQVLTLCEVQVFQTGC